MQTTKHAAGPIAPRTDGDAPHPQNSTATTCDGCNERDADGMNPDGRSLCRPCARRARTLICDGGEADDTTTCERCGTKMGVFDQHVELREKNALDTMPKGARLFLCEYCGDDFHKFLDDDRDDALDRLASEFQNRHEQANISKTEYANRGDERAADFQQGRVLAFQEARSVVLAVKDGDSDE